MLSCFMYSGALLPLLIAFAQDEQAGRSNVPDLLSHSSSPTVQYSDLNRENHRKQRNLHPDCEGIVPSIGRISLR